MRKVPEPVFHVFMRAAIAPGTASGGTKAWNRCCGSTLAMTARARIAVPSSSTMPVARSRSTMTSRTAVRTSMRTPWVRGGACHRLRDGPHAADGVAPHALLAVHFAEDVMQQHVSGARRVRARQIADHRIEAEHGLDRIGIEPAVEHIAGRFAQEAERRRDGVVLPQPLADGRKLAELARAMAEIAQRQIGRRGKHEAAQHIGDTADLGLIGAIAGGVLGAEFRDLVFAAALAGEQIAAIGQRQEILRAALDDAQAMLVQLEIANDLWLQQAHRIGRGRVAEAGPKFLRHRGAADDTAPLNDAHAQARHAEIGRAGQPVVAGADDDGIKVGHGNASVAFVWRR